MGPASALAPGVAAALGPAVGCILDALPSIVTAVIGGVVLTLAEKLWARRTVTQPAVTHAGTPFTKAVLEACPHFTSGYDAVDLLHNRNASTILASVCRQNLDVRYQREVLRMADGGHVTLDWPLSVPLYPGEKAPPPVERAARQSAPAEDNGPEGKDVDAIIRTLQYGDAGKQRLGSAGADGVPGRIGAAAGGGSDGCGSGGGGCDVSGDSTAPPYRRSIPDQGRTVLRPVLANLWRQLPDDAPVLILMSGIAGGSHDKYLKHFLRRAHRRGFRVVAFNCRGTSESPLTTPQFYSASFTGDIRAVVEELAGRWPEAKLFAVGWSLGANILTNFLGEEGADAKLTAAVAMCNPFDLNACDDALQKGFFGTIYSRSMAGNMRKLFAPHAHLFAGLPKYDCALADAAKTVRDFDDAVTRVTFGFPSVDAYYEASSSRHKIPDVRVPLLVVQAADDPIAVHDAVPREAIRNNGHVVLVETESGGHLGWTAGKEAPFGSPWPDVGAMQFLEAMRDGVGQTPRGTGDEGEKGLAAVDGPQGAAVEMESAGMPAR